GAGRIGRHHSDRAGDRAVTAISLALSDYVRGIAKTRPILLRNMYVEKDPGNQVDGLVRLQRPALALFAPLPEGVSRGLFPHAGVLGGDYLCVYGGSLYRVTAAGAATR